MPITATVDKRVTAFRKPTPVANWSTFVAALADTSIKYVRAPAGTYDLGSGISIAGQDRVIDCEGSIFTVNDTVLLPLVIQSENVAGLANEKQCQGEISSATDSVTVVDSAFAATISIGDYHVIRLGVQWYDPQEPNYSCIRRVVGKTGNVLTYDRPFGYSCQVFADYDELKAGTIYDDRVGPWGETSETGAFQRGLGTDHGIRTIGTLARGIVLRNCTILYDGTERMYGAWGVWAHACRDVKIENLTLINPHGSAIHYFLVDGGHIDGAHIGGTGRGAPFGGTTKTNSAVAFSSWSSLDCVTDRLMVDATDCDLYNFEAGNRAMVFNDCRIKNALPTLTASPSIGSYGPGDVTINRLKVNMDNRKNSRLFPSYLNETVLHNLNIETEALPDTFIWVGKGQFLSGFTWYGQRFTAPEVVVVEFTASSPNTVIPYPDGIIMECSWTILDRTGFTSWSIGGDPFSENPGALTFAKSVAQNQISVNETYASYRARIEAHRIYRSSGTAPVTMTCKVMREVAA